MTIAGGADASRGIGFPRLYDLLLRVLTRGRERAYREDLLDLAGIGPGMRVLDVGCGTGTQAIASWRRSQPRGSVVGIDISEAMLAVARRKARRAGLRIAFHRANADALPLEDDRFDVVTITTVMHMIPQSRRRLCLREASRVLRRGPVAADRLRRRSRTPQALDGKMWPASALRPAQPAKHEEMMAAGARWNDLGRPATSLRYYSSRP